MLRRITILVLGSGVAAAAYALTRSGALSLSCETRLELATTERQEFWVDHAKDATRALVELSDTVSARIAADGSIHFFDASAYGRQLRACETDPSRCGPIERTPPVTPTVRQRDAARVLQGLLAKAAIAPDEAAGLVEACPAAQHQTISNDMSRLWSALMERYPKRLDILDTCRDGTVITSWQSSTRDGGRSWALAPNVGWCMPDRPAENAT